MSKKTLQKSTYIVNLGNHRVRVRADHRIMLAMLPIAVLAQDITSMTINRISQSEGVRQ